MKRYLILLFFFATSMQLQSQEFNFGIKAGLNVSTITGDVAEGVNPRLAYHFGGVANIPVSEKFSLSPELLYFSIGSTFDFRTEVFDAFDPTVNTSFKTVERANFLAVPVNFRYSFSKRFSIDFGPQISFLLNTVSKVKEANSVDPIFIEKRKFSGNFRPDYGANLGITFSSNEKINIQLRYYQGLKNLINSDFLIDKRRFNIALQLSVGYVIF